MDFLEWQAFEYDHRPHTADWYWGLGIIGVSLAIAAVLWGDVIFAILIIVITIVLGLHAREHPTLHHFQINNRGVMINDTLYPYDTLESFWVEETPAGSRVLLKSKKLLMPLIIMPIESSIISDTIRAYLLRYLPEVQHGESIFHAFMDYLGF